MDGDCWFPRLSTNTPCPINAKAPISPRHDPSWTGMISCMPHFHETFETAVFEKCCSLLKHNTCPRVHQYWTTIWRFINICLSTASRKMESKFKSEKFDQKGKKKSVFSCSSLINLQFLHSQHCLYLLYTSMQQRTSQVVITCMAGGKVKAIKRNTILSHYVQQIIAS